MAKRGIQGAVLRGLGARDYEVTVTATELLAPRFLRVHFTTPTLLDEIEIAPTSWLRFWFPDPDDGDIEYQRGYTISTADPEAGTFTADFVLHDPAGPASLWALTAEPGMTLTVTPLGSTKFELPEQLPEGYLLVGDSASMPGISQILATIPAEVPVELYLEEHHPDDRLIPLHSHPRLTVHWVHRDSPESMAEAIEARDWSNWSSWAAHESGSLKRLRTRLRDDFGFPKSESYQIAYWIEGRAMGKKREAVSVADLMPQVEQVEQAAAAEMTTTTALSEAGADEAAVADVALSGGVAAEAAVAAPTEAAPEPATPAKRGTWRANAAGTLLAPLKPIFIVAGVVQGIVTVLQLAPYFLLVELARLLISGAEAQRLWTLGIWAAALMAAGALLASALLLWLHAVDARFERDLRARLLGKLGRLPLGWFEHRTAGQVKQLVQDDTLALHYLVTHAVPDAVAAVVAPIAVLGYLFVVDWRVALVLFVPVLVYIVSVYIMIMQSGEKTSQASKWVERMNSEAGGYLEGQPVIRIFGGSAASTFKARLSEYIAFLNDWQRPFIAQKTIMDLATRPGTFVLIIVLMGTALVTGGSMQPVNLLPFLLLGTTFGGRLIGIGFGLSGLRSGLLAARRLQVALDEPELETAPGVKLPAARSSEQGRQANTGRVCFDRVMFEYRAGVPVLHDISLTLEPGTITALVGPSGSGKSTLASLLARFYDVSAGSITIEGRDLRSMQPDELYRLVSFVFQDSQLVQGTVAENIALARPDASREEIIRVATAAQIHDRIERMPNGYDTLVGASATLSGGEKQRLTIARALLADTPVVVLDEATAFADPESEYLVQQALSRLTRGRTVLVIAHRLHTITEADQIAVLSKGQIAEMGNHETLLSRGGVYEALWRAGQSSPTTEPAANPEAAR
ncbi:ABC transporter ATP-binding protein/permease [Leucobacter chinensis]|uniref:ABC transporter ATP-binding protein/permease n=1 Tax=Leucobacter chinensis TaxID=2851010 RepID=UPI001C21CC4B|nr:ABC transporter ATP-binding protein/permease [Leucobacter chinensis]